MRLNAKIDLGNLDKRLMLTSKNVAFASAKAINDTLTISQRSQIRYMQRTYQIRRPTLLRYSVKMIKFARASSLTGTVGLNPNPRLNNIWSKFEQGDTKIPRGRNLAIPQDIRTSARGGVTKANQPRNLRRSFRIQSGGRDYLLYRRGRGSRSESRLAYSLVPRARTPANLRFVQNVTKAVEGTWDRNMSNALDRELRRNNLI